jgi:pyrroline-5-carboxylate reductase
MPGINVSAATERIEAGRLGFLGTGTIASAIVAGLCSGAEPDFRIFLSPRNAQIADRLASTFPQVTVAASTQELLDCSDRVILAVRPQIAHDVLASLRFRPDHRVISLIATFSQAQIAALVAPAARITCAAPLPTAASRASPTVIFPPDPVASNLFDRLGVAVEVTNESEFRALLATTAAMASYFSLLDTLSSWLKEQGVSRSTAREYISMMFHGLGQVPRISALPFAELADEFKTKGGLNEQFAEELRRNGVFAACSAGLDAILARLAKGGSRK